VLNEEESVTVYYLGGSESRKRRVRRSSRPPPEERWRQSASDYNAASDYETGRMSAYCTYLAIDLEDAVRRLESRDEFRIFGERATITSYSDVVHCSFYSSAAGIRDAFIFPYGSVLLWGFEAQEELEYLAFLEECSEPIAPIAGSLKAEDIVDSEFMLFREERPDEADYDPKAYFKNNIVILRTGDPLEKLAISFAFAQSAKLAVLEASLDVTIEDTRAIPEQLAKTGRSKFTSKQVAKLVGRVFLQRNEANLYSNILDCPDFFWEAEGFEPLYRRVNRYLDIEDRVLILNKRLDIVNDLLDSLNGQLEIRNSHRLEIIIILLIMFEILLEVAKESTPLFALPVQLFRRLILRR